MVQLLFHTAQSSKGAGEKALPPGLSTRVQVAERRLLTGRQAELTSWGGRQVLTCNLRLGAFGKSVRVYLSLQLHFWEECQETNISGTGKEGDGENDQVG